MRILIVEDDAELAASLERRLQAAGHDVTSTSDGREASGLVRRNYDVAIVDRMLADGDGLDVLAAARTAGIDIPVIMLTALGQIADRVEGLSAGADDYLVKPFAFDELLARIQAVARRRGAGTASGHLASGRLALDLLHREVRLDGRLIPLQPREVRLLEALVRNADITVTRTMLLETVWGFHFDPQTNLVETHVSRLRSKLALGGLPDAIETIRGSGYRFRTASSA